MTMQKTSTFAMVIIGAAAIAGILGIGPTTMITAYGQTSEQPPITSNDECLPGSEVHCIDDDDHTNLRDLFELDVNELLALDADDLLERFGHNN
jgi:hypothetical protein